MKYLAIAAITSAAAADYVWPGPHERMEDLLYCQSGFNRLGFIDGILGCGFGQNVAGQQNSAEWIRAAFHDMSTADVKAGTGGLDASIMFETFRDENNGHFINNTFGHFHAFHTTRSSGADLLALGVVGSMSVCGGQEIPLRVGRIDALEAGPAGVPKPEEDLDRHTKIFAQAGFNETEMIELVACGHTLGGVHGEFHPEIVDDVAPGDVTHFELGESTTSFDNKVVTEYLEDDTPNPLVVAKNDTFNSDKRIFSLDGNKTMHALADPAHFQNRCQTLFTRMIDTVPSTVKLSDPLTPVDVKPYVNTLALNSKGTIDFSGYIRVRYGQDTGRTADDTSAYITYTNRAGKAVNQTVEATRPTYQGGTGSGFNGVSFVYFEWDTTVPADEGISAFTIHVTTPSTGKTIAYENGGKGFPVQDTVLYQLHQSCQTFTQNADKSYSGSLTVVAAVRTDAIANKDVELKFAKHVKQQAVLDKLEIQTEKFSKTEKTLAGYTLFEVKDMSINEESDQTTLDIVLGGETKIDFMNTGALSQESCVPLVK